MARGGGHHSGGHHGGHSHSHHHHHRYRTYYGRRMGRGYYGGFYGNSYYDSDMPRTNKYESSMYSPGNSDDRSYINLSQRERDFYNRQTGWTAKIYGLIIVCIMLVYFVGLFSNIRFDFSSAGLSPSKGNVILTQYCFDMEDIMGDTSGLIKDLTYYYEKTGIQPVVYAINDSKYHTGNGSITELEKLYDSLFRDENHFMLVVSSDLYGRGQYTVSYFYGANVDKVMTSGVIKRFFAYFDNNVSSNLSISNAIGKSFRQVADYAIADNSVGGGIIGIIVMLVIAVTGIVAVIVIVSMRNKEAKLIREVKPEIMYDDMPEMLTPPEKDKKPEGGPDIYGEKEDTETYDDGPLISWEDALKEMRDDDSV